MAPFQFTHSGTTYHVVVDQRGEGFTMSSEGVGLQHYTVEEFLGMKHSLWADKSWFDAFGKDYEDAHER